MKIFAALLVVLSFFGGAHARAAPPISNRVALIVGANRPGPGRVALQHAYRDADRMREVLTTVGRFAPQNVIQLQDPTPADLLAAINRHSPATPAGGESLFFFYYSGHADERSLFPSGQPLSFETLREALDRTGASVRVGVVDACRGGAWTRAKGLTPDTSFEVETPVNLGSEGSVLIASSSGSESAHESDQLQGSFFTHHFVAGLLGAADKSENGEVTVSEAFEYAKLRTVRDTARVAREPQHPSYSMNLRGRQDLVLAQIATSPSTVVLSQTEGPLEIIQLESGLSVLELAPGHRRVRVALRPGRYLVRRTTTRGNLAEEVSVVAGTERRVEESELTMVGVPPMLAKGGPVLTPPALTGSTLPRRSIVLGLSLGVYAGTRNFVPWSATETELGDTDVQLAGSGLAVWGITDRLSWDIGTGDFAYRFGQRGGWELIPAGGVLGWSWDVITGFKLLPGFGVAVRRWFSQRTVATVTAGVLATLNQVDDFHLGDGQRSASLGISHTVHDVITFNFAVGLERTHVAGAPGNEWMLKFGSVQRVGLLSRPLIQLHLSDSFDVGVDASVGQLLSSSGMPGSARRETNFTALFGFTYLF